MRCKYCGSTSIHSAKEHKNFSAGKAVAGAVAFGVVGAAAGFIGKEKDGHRCGACGAFMETPMDFSTEFAVNNAISEAEAGRNTAMYYYYKRQYANIQANVPVLTASTAERMVEVTVPQNLQIEENVSQVKYAYRFNTWIPECPIHIESIYIKTKDGKDYLSVSVLNQSEATIRSAYFDVVVFDDTGDEVSTCKCIYQNVNTISGAYLPVEQEFELNTNIAYRVSIKCEKVALSDDSVWRWTEGIKEYTLPAQNELTEDTFPRFKYLRENLATASVDEKTEALYLPIDMEDYWLCICGRPQLKGQDQCLHCGAEHAKFETLLSQQYLQEKQLESIKNRAASRAKDTIALYEKAYNKRFEDVYKAAETEESTSTIDSMKKAIELFASIPEWKDATSRKANCEEKLKALEKKQEEERIAAEKKAEEERIAEKKSAEERAKKNKKITIIGCVAAVVVLAVIILYISVIQPSMNYKSAVALLEAGKYDEAYDAFKAMGNYKDAEQQLVKTQELIIQQTEASVLEYIASGRYDEAEELVEELQPETLAKQYMEKIRIERVLHAKEGDTVTFGVEEDGDALEWLVLNSVDNEKEMLLISLYEVERMTFSDTKGSGTSITWANSNVREWLNGDFYNTCFGEAEKELIKTHTYNVNQVDAWGKPTTLFQSDDKVSLLGVEEVEAYKIHASTLLRDIRVHEPSSQTYVVVLDQDEYELISFDSKMPIVPIIWIDRP